MPQGDMNLKDAFEKNFYHKKPSTLIYVNFTSNSTKHRVRLTREERLIRVQTQNIIFIYKVINIKNVGPRLQGDGFTEYLVARNSKCSSNEVSNLENPWLKGNYIINKLMYNIELIKLSNESLKNSKLTWSSDARSLLWTRVATKLF